MSQDLKLSGASGRERFIHLLADGDLNINWEIYSSGDSMGQETTLVIAREEFGAINLRYGFSANTPIMEVLKDISDSGRGDQFMDELYDGTIPLKEKFVY